MIKYVMALAMIVSLGFTGPHPRKQEEPLIVNNAISLHIPVKYETNEELNRVLFSANDKMVYAAILATTSGKCPFAVSVYRNKERTEISKAFSESVHYNSTNSESYKLLDWGVYKKENKTLRFKISEISFGDTKTNSIMYYFMKSNASTELYEIKISCNPKNTKELKILLEKIALSLEFF